MISKAAGSEAVWGVAVMSATSMVARDNDETVAVHGSAPAWGDENGRFQRFDDDRTIQPGARRHEGAIVDFGPYLTCRAEPEITVELVAGRGAVGRDVADRKGWDLADRTQTDIDKLHRLPRIVVAIGLAVLLMEAGRDRCYRRRLIGGRRGRDVELIGLAGVAGVDRTLEAAPVLRHTGALQHGASRGL